MKFLVGFALIWINISCSSLENKNNKSKAILHLQIGTKHLTEGRYPSALEELLMAKKLDPKNAIVRNNLGLAYLVRLKYKTASLEIQEALKLKPNYTDAKNNLGRVYIHQKKYNKSIEILKSALRDLTYRTPEKTYSSLGLAYFKNRQFKLAKEILKKALDIRRDNCSTYNLYGRSLYALKDYSTATIAFDKASKLCKPNKFIEPLFYSAMSFYRLKKRLHAKARFEEILYLHPESEFAKKSKMVLKILKGN